MKILLVYPEYPNTFWSFRYALRFISKKASLPPLGLLTVSAMLPRHWARKLVDMNIETLTDDDIKWADYVFLSAMSVQRSSADEVIERCRALGTKIVAGGPHFTSYVEEYDHVEHLVLNEAEITLPGFLEDLEQGDARHVYSSTEWADVSKTPVPEWGLADLSKYASMAIQYSRGCPFDCDFCNITVLYGRKPRTKSAEQILAELQSMHDHGWRAGVFFVDDNFIGNKKKLKEEIMPALIGWSEKMRHPFPYLTETSINLADDDELMRMMVEAGFDTVFIGIETPHEESLIECSKHNNKNRDLIACVKKIQRSGLQVQGGFIVGFDSDPVAIFDKVIAFIQESGIATAMVGLLNAPRGTKLFKRLTSEGRLLNEPSGDNTDFSMNFVPKMSKEVLLKGYRNVVDTIYSPKHYYARVKEFLKEYEPSQPKQFRMSICQMKALARSILLLGIVHKERFQYWKLFFWSLFTRPRLFPLAITLSIYGHHFRKTFEKVLA